jgi:hypothetical protein
MFSMASKVKPNPIQKAPDFSDPWDAVKAFGKVTKQLGKDAANNSTNESQSNVNTKPVMIWQTKHQKYFDTSDKSQYVSKYGDDSLTFFEPRANQSNDPTKPDTGIIINFKTPKK